MSGYVGVNNGIGNARKVLRQIFSLQRTLLMMLRQSAATRTLLQNSSIRQTLKWNV